MVIHIAIDCMGGDHGLSVTIPAAVEVARQDADIRFLAVGDELLVREALSSYPEHIRARFEIVHASQVVAMDDSVDVALRNRKDSSMRVAISLVKEGRASACVSAGNTGALMATARYVLKTMQGIDRPAIATGMPTVKGGKTNMMDLGANIDCTAEQLLQFALMGAAMTQALNGVDRPRVGLLNIGTEAIKGGETVQKAATLLRQSSLNFVGFVEGNDIFTGEVDVVVCDGFVGNSILKSLEGFGRMLSTVIASEFKRGIFSKMAAVFSFGVLRNIRRRLDNRKYNGAMLLGLNGIVVKSHGSADVLAYSVAIHNAIEMVRHNMLDRIHAEVAKLKELHE